MHLTTETAKRLNELYRTPKEFFSNSDNGKIVTIINFKNELKNNIDKVVTRDSKILSPDGTFKINCECQFCKWTKRLIQEIESVENDNKRAN